MKKQREGPFLLKSSRCFFILQKKYRQRKSIAGSISSHLAVIFHSSGFPAQFG